MLFCLKTIVKSQLDEQSFNQLIREIKIQSYLSFMNHPNIVSLYSFTADAENVYLLLEACPGQNLFKRLKSHPIK
jgi:serine/threonine protein kinase